MEPSDRWGGFVREVEAIVAHGGTEKQITAAVADALQELLRARDFLGPEALQVDPERYAMYPLHVDAAGRFSIASAVWGVAQSSPIHDHGTWGVIGIYAGVENERRYQPTPTWPRYLETRTLSPGQVAVCCTSDADLHAVRCGSDEPCVGIHVYGADIGTLERRAYDPATGAQTTFVSGWSSARPPAAAPGRG